MGMQDVPLHGFHEIVAQAFRRAGIEIAFPSGIRQPDLGIGV